MKTVYLGMSGGVDSSVSALLLKQQGYKVVGVYMKNWSKDIPGTKCPWARDLADAKRVAVGLDIDFKVFDFETEYKQKVVNYMLAEYEKGHTPNPDIMCNQEIKFKLFAETAFEQGADLIATGHYAQTDSKQLLRAADENKDQTYFLYRIDPKVLAKTLFPIGHLKKPAVKKLAKEHNLHVATKPESMGVCFVGNAGIREFLEQYIDHTPGKIRDHQTNEILGTHDGVIFYTLGQRHGLDLGGGLPYYVVAKDMKKNTIYASRNLNTKELWTQELKLTDLFFRDVKPADLYFRAAVEEGPLAPISSRTAATAPCKDRRARERAPGGKRSEVFVRLRHRAPLIPAILGGDVLRFLEPIRRPAPGQSAVFYDGQTCLGGGIIT